MSDPSTPVEMTAALPRAMFSVAEFCTTHAISRSTLYQMVAFGHGPALSKVGRRTLISAEAAERWRREIERPKETAAPPKPAPMSKPRQLTAADAPMIAAR